MSFQINGENSATAIANIGIMIKIYEKETSYICRNIDKLTRCSRVEALHFFLEYFVENIF